MIRCVQLRWQYLELLLRFVHSWIHDSRWKIGSDTFLTFMVLFVLACIFPYLLHNFLTLINTLSIMVSRGRKGCSRRPKRTVLCCFGVSRNLWNLFLEIWYFANIIPDCFLFKLFALDDSLRRVIRCEVGILNTIRGLLEWVHEIGRNIMLQFGAFGSSWMRFEAVFNQQIKLLLSPFLLWFQLLIFKN